jgi:hypothetical protein
VQTCERGPPLVLAKFSAINDFSCNFVLPTPPNGSALTLLGPREVMRGCVDSRYEIPSHAREAVSAQH